VVVLTTTPFGHLEPCSAAQKLHGCIARSVPDRGAQSEIARRLGVSRSTVCRDIATLIEDPIARENERRRRRLARQRFSAFFNEMMESVKHLSQIDERRYQQGRSQGLDEAIEGDGSGLCRLDSERARTPLIRFLRSPNHSHAARDQPTSSEQNQTRRLWHWRNLP
jgi:hypothetical protein